MFLDNRLERLKLNRGDKGQLLLDAGRVSLAAWLPDLAPGLSEKMLRAEARLPRPDRPVLSELEVDLEGQRLTAKRLRFGPADGAAAWSEVLARTVARGVPQWELMDLQFGSDVPLELSRVEPGKRAGVSVAGRIGPHAIAGNLRWKGTRKPVAEAKGHLAGAPFNATARWKSGKLGMPAALRIAGQTIDLKTKNGLDSRGVFTLHTTVRDPAALGLVGLRDPKIGLPVVVDGTIAAGRKTLDLALKIPRVEFEPPWELGSPSERVADPTRESSRAKASR